MNVTSGWIHSGPRSGRRIAALGSWGLLLLGAVIRVAGQGVTLLTEDTLPAPVARFPVSGPVGQESLFQMEFGFGTNETPSPGELHDSLTLMLTGFQDGKERVLATLDVFGLTPKPMIEGAGDFSSTPLSFQAAPFHPISPFEVTLRQSFSLQFPLPSDWLGQGELTGVLASNGDLLKSMAYVGEVLVTAVPEPSIEWLALGGGALCFLLQQRREGKRR